MSHNVTPSRKHRRFVLARLERVTLARSSSSLGSEVKWHTMRKSIFRGRRPLCFLEAVPSDGFDRESNGIGASRLTSLSSSFRRRLLLRLGSRMPASLSQIENSYSINTGNFHWILKLSFAFLRDRSIHYFFFLFFFFPFI